ncbi:hypothetical protein Ddc_11886 [Ditylenchus destructor]|nr:hypothetical protein Ddc_11886 [Ditylenchus destructor]
MPPLSPAHATFQPAPDVLLRIIGSVEQPESGLYKNRKQRRGNGKWVGATSGRPTDPPSPILGRAVIEVNTKTAAASDDTTGIQHSKFGGGEFGVVSSPQPPGYGPIYS